MEEHRGAGCGWEGRKGLRKEYGDGVDGIVGLSIYKEEEKDG